MPLTAYSQYPVVLPRYSRDGARASWLRAHASDIVLLATVQAALFIPGAGAAIALGLLCVFSLFGVDRAIKALLVSALATFANPAVFHTQVHVAEFKWLLLLFGLWATIKAPRTNFRYPAGIIVSAALFLGTAAFVSLLFGLSPALSMFKLASFALGLVTTFRLAARTKTDIEEWTNFLIVFWLWVVAVSLPLLFISAGSGGPRATGDFGFQGVISHPQSFAVLIAALPAIAFLRSLTTPGKMAFAWMLVGAVGIFMLFESRARTGMLACFLSSAVTVLVYLSKGSRNRMRVVGRLIALFFVSLLIVLMSGGAIIVAVQSALHKHTNTGQELDWSMATVAQLLNSRKAQINQQTEVVNEEPFTGTGFGVQNTGQVEHAGEPESSFMGIPLSSPNEPGFLPLAVLAQVGVAGALFFWIGICCLFSAVLKGRRPEAMGLFTVLLAVNLGEAIGFSFGGLGLYMWMGIALAVRGSFPMTGMGRTLALARRGGMASLVPLKGSKSRLAPEAIASRGIR